MLALKVDIDTRRGMEQGLPQLLELLESRQVRASVYFSFGPDESGKAVKRVFTRKGFLKKMFRTNAAKLYGFKTMLYGTLLPAPLVASALPELVKLTAQKGHETGVHAWSHVRWQDDLDSMSQEEIEGELYRAVEAYRKILGAEPEGFAAPAWKMNAKALAALDKYGWKYVSVARGPAPVRPRMGRKKTSFIEIPTTLPTLDEILAWDAMTADKALDWLAFAPKKGELNVYTLHSEAEGMSCLPFFTALLDIWKKRGFDFITMHDAAARLDAAALPDKEIIQGVLPGRAGEIAAV
jgi:peptidoglycan/xylan/chitin deacetylase (PgdA/CDA1 family)